VTGPFLLDTHVLIWVLTAPDRLRTPVRDALSDPTVHVAVSAASTWEVAIKAALGKLPPPPPDLPAVLTRLGLRALPIEVEDTLAVQALPLHHRDPFDRLLVAQALRHDLTLITSDGRLATYGVPTLMP
jgi:PIN domain nuclease of toxin-antitoxin system